MLIPNNSNSRVRILASKDLADFAYEFMQHRGKLKQEGGSRR
jgi:hypothetical protein